MLKKLPEKTNDPWIPLAANAAAARHAEGFLAESMAVSGPANEPTRAAVRIVAEHIARGDRDAARRLVPLLSKLKDADGPIAEALLAGLSAGWPKGPKNAPALDATDVDAMVTLMPRLGPAGQLAIATLASRWGLESRFATGMNALRTSLARVASDSTRPEPDRISAAHRLAEMNPDRETLERMLSGVNVKASPTLAAGLLDAAGTSTTPELARALLARWGELTPQMKHQGVDILLRRPEWSRGLLDAIEARTLSTNDLSTDQSQQLANHPDRSIAARARTLLAMGGALPNPDRMKVLKSLLAVTEKTGNLAHGLEVFKNNCAKCHRHGDIGESIGPNLTGFAVHPKDKILTEIIDPNRSVEGNFRQYTVALRDGRVLNGLLASETRTAIELVDAEARRQAVLREDIDEIITSNKSLMPEGFEKQITPADFTDLLEFLAARGKYFPLPMEKAATIVSTQGMFYSKNAAKERLIFPDWSTRTVEEVPFQLIDPRGTGAQRGDAPWARRYVPAHDAPVGHAAVQRAGEGDPPPERDQRLGLSRRRGRLGLVDRPAPLSGRLDRGPRAQERGPLRRLHPAGRRPGIEVRLRVARRTAGPVSHDRSQAYRYRYPRDRSRQGR